MQNQEKIWDYISEFWSKYRVHSPKLIQDFLKNKKNNILDLGCGSGRNFPDKQPQLINQNNQIIYGVDFSKQMLKLAEKKIKIKKTNVILFKSNSIDLPFDSNFFNAGICISLLNTILKKDQRVKTLKEIYRVLKPDAELMISTWNKNTKKLKNLKKQGTFNWNSENKSFQREYYFYDSKELVNELKLIGFKINKVLKSDEDKFTRKNIIIYCKK